MSILDDKINSLSSDELDLLNSDPKMLGEFKAKYSQPQETSTLDVAKQGLQAALPSPDSFNKPLSLAEDTSPMGAIKGGAQAALETLKDPTRMSMSVSQPGQVAGEKVSSSLQDSGVNPMVAKGAGFATGIALDPQTYMLGHLINADELNSVKTGLGNIMDKVGGTFAEKPTPAEIESAQTAVQNSLNKAKTMAEGKLNAVKEKFSTPPNFEDVSDVGEPKASLKELKDKFQSYFKSRAPQMEEAGMTAPEGTGVQQPPNVEVYSKGTMGGGVSPNTGKPLPKTTIWGVRGDPAEIEKLGFGKEPGSIPEDTLKKMGLLGDNGPIATVTGPTFASPKEEIGHLINMRQALQDEIRPGIADQAGNIVKKVGTIEEGKVRNMIGRINERIAQLPGGDAIREAESHYSNARSVFDDLQSKLDEPGQAENFLQRLFKNPTGKNKDYLNKLATVEQMTGQPVVSNLFDLYKQAAKGISYEELKHPVANMIKSGVPGLGSAVKGLASAGTKVGAIVGRGLQTPFNTPDMQSLRDRLETTHYRDTKYAAK